MASNSYIDFELKNPVLFQKLKKIGVYFSEDGRDCKLSTGEKYEFFFADGDSLPYLGFDDDFMIGMYLECFLGCGNQKFCYHFMKIMTENGYFESSYDFETNPFDNSKYYECGFYKQFKMTKKLTNFDSTIESAYTEGVEADYEITAFRVLVENGVMTVCDIQFEFEMEECCDFELDSVFDVMEEEEFVVRKVFRDGCWVELED